MSRLWIYSAARARVFEILDEEFMVGSSGVCAIRVEGPGVAAEHLRVVRQGRSHRVEAATDGVDVRVNGRATTGTQLRHGDEVAVGDVILVYGVAGEPPPPRPSRSARHKTPSGGTAGGLGLSIGPIASRASRSAPRGRTGGAATAGPGVERGARGRRRSGRPAWFKWLMVWNAVLASGLVLFLLSRSLGSGGIERDPAGLVALAESQRRSGAVADALATLDAAERLGPDVETRGRIEALRTRIVDARSRAANLERVESARVRADRIEQFVRYYLADDATARAPNRVLGGLAQQWLAEFGETCRVHPDGRELVARVERRLEDARRYGALDTSDTADDVLFAADRLVRFRQRRYREALELLDGWLVAHPDAPADNPVRTVRGEYLDAGHAWTSERLETIERHVRQGQIEYAAAELRFLVDGGVPSDWLGGEAQRLEASMGR